MIVGIDASNIRSGGGISHLKNLLHHTRADRDGIQKIVIWLSADLAAQLPRHYWLQTRVEEALSRGLQERIRFQQSRLPALLKRFDVDVLLSPGGTVPFNSPVPCVTMFRNALPFERREVRRYPIRTKFRLQLELLRIVQTISMRRADGLIFLSEYAASLAPPSVRPNRTVVIPHGIEARFFSPLRRQLPLTDFTDEKPFRLLYVSPVSAYKHQWNVVAAVDGLRRRGLPVTVDFVGGLTEPRAVKRLRTALASLSTGHSAARLLGPARFEDIHQYYHAADGFVFASSCENLPNTLLEAMAAGLPIASSCYPPMPEVLGDGAVYFNPESSSEIGLALETLIRDESLRDRVAHRAHSRAQGYSWNTAAGATWRFVATISGDHGSA